MSKAKKLKSGSWRCQVHIKCPDGHVDRTSFTASTRSEAERLARQYESHTLRFGSADDMTISQAIDSYIDSKRKILSPASIVEYQNKARRYYTAIGDIHLNKITKQQLQIYVNGLVSAGLSPHTVKDIYGLLSATLDMFLPDSRFHVTLPPVLLRELTTPESADVKRLIDAADPELRKCIVLAAVGTMRRGECCALKYGDISRDMSMIHVHSDMVKTPDHEWVCKDMPKTAQSIRTIFYPSEVIELLGDGYPDQYVIHLNPNMVTKRFGKLCRSLGINCRFHDLRHYAASIMDAIGVPRSYIENAGGWSKDSTVLRRLYLNPINEFTQKYGKQTVEYFQSHLFNERTHENTHAVSENA
ncbi:Phage integrase family protein [Lachnospiraceae bacterium NK3A20]|nr:Phage integrase family protein [Lachnospiraceae bacterium NK3A20]